VSWPFETSEPLVTPEQAAEAVRAQRGISPEAWRLPPALVLTFQRIAFAHLLERTALASAETSPSGPRVDPLVGSFNGMPVVVARSGIGAPAADLLILQSGRDVRPENGMLPAAYCASISWTRV
jgi:hypothetical protein